MAGNDYIMEKRNINILIVEDEPPIAREIERLTQQHLNSYHLNICIAHVLTEAFIRIEQTAFDLCLLDLQLANQSGFDILHGVVSRNFHAIIISAHTDMAIEAFEYGVLDFVPKPIKSDRLKLAFNRFLGLNKPEHSGVKYLVVRKRTENHIISISNVLFFKADGYLVEIHLGNGRMELYDKPLNRLEQILPENFIRIHRSFITDINQIQFYRHKGNAVYEIVLKNGLILPMSNGQFKIMKDLLSGFQSPR
jgi:DNA-binding LytR/AlgR family response regulator